MRGSLRLAKASVAAVLALALGSCSGAPRRGSGAARPDVLLVTVDSLREDRVDWKPGGTMPAIASLAARGTRFTRAYTVAPWTAPSLVSIFTGLYPQTHGVVNRDDTTPAALPTLPRILRARGWALANFGFFTEVSYYRNLGLPPQAVTGAEVIGADALARWLAHPPEPFFAWIHLVEPHLPYGAGGYEAAEAKVGGSTGLLRAQVSATVPVGGPYRFDPGDAGKLRALYDADLARLDAALGKVLAALGGRAERTIVVLTADHGEELLDHGWIGHASTSGEAKLTEELLHVPLVFAGPRVPAARRTDALAQNVDVFPTILALAGARVPAGTQGISLVPALRGGDARKRVFFHTLPGGHLTPESRRGETLEGVGDGTRLHAERIGAPRRADDPRAPALAGDLARFRRSQARARLAMLERYGAEKRPDAAAAAGWPETLVVREPEEGARLESESARGTIRLAWDAVGTTSWVEYEVGSGLLSAKGAFPVEGSSVAFGPFPVAFWNDLAGYAPFRFRVLDPSGKRRSSWRSFTLERTERE